MSHAEVCPVCGGKGWVHPRGYDSTTWYWMAIWPWQTCSNCGGNGWVEISDGPEVPVTSTKIPDVPGEEKK